MEADFEDTINRLAGGMLLTLLGLVLALLFQFIIRMLLFRSLNKDDYGVIILGMVILEFVVILAGLGLKAGSPRFISYHRGEDRPDKIRGVIVASVRLSIISSIFFALLIFLLAGPLSSAFKSPGLSFVLRLFSLALPFSIALALMTAIFRGFDRVGIKVVFEDITLYGLSAAFITIAIINDAGLRGTAIALTAAHIITGIAVIIYSVIKLPRTIDVVPAARLTKILLYFSIPLALESALATIAFWTDTIMLGLFKAEDVVGTYNVAVPFANLLPIFLVAFIYIYLPVATKSLAEGKIEEIRTLYRSATKWSFLLTLPLLLTFVLFSRPVIVFFAGIRYEDAAAILAILSAGFFIHVLLGPNGATLVVLGKPKLLLYDGIIGLVLNIVLNALFIPKWGMVGAALASSISLTLMNSIKSVQIYLVAKINPFTSSYLKPVALTVLSSAVLYLPFAYMLEDRYALVLIIYPLILVLSLLLTLLSRSLEAEDIAFISFILIKLRLNPSRVQHFLTKFLPS